MVYKCMICSEKPKGINKDKPFFEVPKNPETRKKWLEIIGVENLVNKINKVCWRHFSKEDIFTFRSSRKLKKNVLPKKNIITNANNDEFSDNNTDTLIQCTSNQVKNEMVT